VCDNSPHLCKRAGIVDESLLWVMMLVLKLEFLDIDYICETLKDHCFFSMYAVPAKICGGNSVDI